MKDTSSDGSSFSAIHVILENKKPHLIFREMEFLAVGHSNLTEG
jgi:hypothetical protein